MNNSPDQENTKVFQVDETGNQRLAEFQPKTAFIKIPLEAKEEVAAFVEGLTGTRQNASGGIDPALNESGCFFVVSLDKIERIMNKLEEGLSVSDDDGPGIKAEIREALRILNS